MSIIINRSCLRLITSRSAMAPLKVRSLEPRCKEGFGALKNEQLGETRTGLLWSSGYVFGTWGALPVWCISIKLENYFLVANFET